jgi:putative transposase
VIYAFIEANKADLPVRLACAQLGVSHSGFYDWRRRRHQPCRRVRCDAELTETITEIHRQSRGTYGTPRIHAELRLARDVRVGRKRVERLMRTAGLQGITRRRRTGCTRRAPVAVPSDDLVGRLFDPDQPDRLWCVDIPEHPSDEGKVYLAVVIDAFSRLVVGWSIADHLRAEFVVDALGIAIAEGFFATLQTELLDRHHWADRRQLARAMFDYLACFYNPIRRHSYCGRIAVVHPRQPSQRINEAVWRPSARGDPCRFPLRRRASTEQS